MSVTEKLLRLFNVDKQYRGLQSRLKAAEKFLAEQHKQLTELESKKSTLDTQLKQFLVVGSGHEGEMKRLDERIAALRTQMDSAQTNKEYTAFLKEVNTIKAERDRSETAALEQMQKADAIRTQLKAIEEQHSERVKVKGVAASDRDQRAAEIKDRLAELKDERAKLAADVPADIMPMFERLMHTRGDDAMAHIEVADRKRHEYHCGGCMMSIPIEAVSALLSSGKLTRCASCQCVLYISAEVAESLQPASKR
jgi:predicted  nucleic acid-binding Zn-ribbon protein